MKLSFTRLNGLIIFCLIAPNYHVMANTVNCLGTYTIDKASTSTHTSLESALNSAKKATPSAKYGDALNSIISELNPDEQLVRLGLDNFNVAKNKENLALAAEKKSLVADHLKNSMPPEVAELSLKRLAKENILLGPIHEILFRYSTDQISGAYRHKFGQKKEFANFKTSMTSSSPGDIAYRQDIASKMHSELIKLVSYFSSFGEFKQLSHVKKLDLLDKYRKYTENKSSIFDYNIKAETLIKNIELLIEINEMPGSKDFFEKVFLNSMEAIYKTCYRRAHGTLETGLEVAKYTVIPGAIALLYHQGVPFAVEPSAVVTALGTVGTLIYDANRGANDSAIPTLKSVPKTLWIKASNFFSKTKVANKLKADSGESTISEAAEVIKSSASISDKLDFDFGGIKQELARGIQRDIHIPNWGKEFSIGVSNLMTRLSLIREELVQINEKVDPIFNEIQQAKINKTTYQREATETLNELYGDKLFALLIDHQAIELDLITLSHALDQYIIGLDKYAKSAEHTPAEQYVINSKSELLRSQLLTLTMFVKPLTDYKQNIITILDTLNMTTASAQMNDMQNLNSKPLRENNKEKKPKEPYEIMRGFHI